MTSSTPGQASPAPGSKRRHLLPVSDRIPTIDLVVSVGTDHHPFDRLIDWIDDWCEHNPDATVVIQHGWSRSSHHASNGQVQSSDWTPHGELHDLFARASVVVTHGGPSTIMEVRHAGRMPLVVPRDPGRGEHVDDHQIRFTAHLHRNQQAIVAGSKDELFERINAGVADPSVFAIATESGAAKGVMGFGEVVDAILDNSGSKRRRR